MLEIEQEIQALLDKGLENSKLSEAEIEALQTALGHLAFHLTRIKRRPDQIKSLGLTEELPEAFTIERAKAGLFYNLKWSDPKYPKKSPLSTDQEFKANKILAQAVELGLLVQTDKLVLFAKPIFQDYFCARHCSKQTFTPELLTLTFSFYFQSVWPIWVSLQPEIVEKLVVIIHDNTLLSSPIRKYAIFAICYTAIEHLQNILFKILLDESESEDIKYKVAETLSQQNGDEIFYVLYRAMQQETSNKYVQPHLARDLGRYIEKLPSEQAAKYISLLETDLIKSYNYQTYLITEVLQSSKKASPSILSYLLDLLKVEAGVLPETARNVVLLLPQIAPASSIIEPLKESLKNADPGVRDYAVRTLAKLNPPDLIEILLKQLFEETKPYVQSTILTRLESTEGNLPKIASQLIPLLPSFEDNDDEGGELQLHAMSLRLLVRTQEEEAREFMRGIVYNRDKTEDIRDRVYMASLLGDMGDTSIISWLQQMLEQEKDFWLRESIASTLYTLGDKSAFEVLVSLLNDKTRNGKHRVLCTITYLGDTRSFEILQENIKDQEANIRWSVISNLSFLKDKRAIGMVMEALNDPEARVRYTAAQTLGYLGAKEALDRLEWLKWNDINRDISGREVRYAAAQAITQINSDNK